MFKSSPDNQAQDNLRGAMKPNQNIFKMEISFHANYQSSLPLLNAVLLQEVTRPYHVPTVNLAEANFKSSGTKNLLLRLELTLDPGNLNSVMNKHQRLWGPNLSFYSCGIRATEKHLQP